jgi:hypothetical protein
MSGVLLDPEEDGGESGSRVRGFSAQCGFRRLVANFSRLCDLATGRFVRFLHRFRPFSNLVGAMELEMERGALNSPKSLRARLSRPT